MMEEQKTKRKNHHKPRKFAVKVVAFIMAFSMVFSLAATCIFYVMNYL